MRVSHETIYQSIYVQGRGALRRELARSLRTGRALRKPRREDEERRGKIPGMVNISERPAEAADRAVPGHWEGDLLIGRVARPRSAPWWSAPPGSPCWCRCRNGMTRRPWPQALTPVIAGLPDALRRSLTWDQGREMKAHAQIAVAADCQIYFCDPHSPWQRGTQREHQRAAAPVLPQGHPARRAQPGAPGRSR